MLQVSNVTNNPPLLLLIRYILVTIGRGAHGALSVQWVVGDSDDCPKDRSTGAEPCTHKSVDPKEKGASE